MKYRHPNPVPSVVAAKHRQHGKRAGQFDQKCPSQDEPCQPDDPSDLRCRDGVLHGAALHQRDSSPGQQRKRCRHGDNTKPADLNQRQDHRLTKDRPIAAGILHHKACYTNSGGRGEKRFMKWRYTPGCCGERQHQQ